MYAESRAWLGSSSSVFSSVSSHCRYWLTWARVAGSGAGGEGLLLQPGGVTGEGITGGGWGGAGRGHAPVSCGWQVKVLNRVIQPMRRPAG